jgi:hypothetical protein
MVNFGNGLGLNHLDNFWEDCVVELMSIWVL